DAISGVDQVPGFVDIGSNFNSSVDDDPNCLGGRGWYYGLDHNEGTAIDFLTVLTHELAHGLGHSNFVNELSGANFLGLTDIYSHFTLDNTTGLHWNEMATDAERAASAVNCRNVAWDGPAATARALTYLSPGTPLLTVDAPASIAGGYPVGAAAFGPQLSNPGVSGTVVLANDGVGATADACEPLVNAGAVAGNVALVDRGACAFVTKVLNAEAAGAIAVIVADNVNGCPPAGLGGADPGITIPSVRITLADGNTLKSELGTGVDVTLGVDPTRLAGADAVGHPLVNAVDPVALGSSISHWDPLTFPNTLMEPAINTDLIPGVDLDLSPGQMSDVGWTLMTTTLLDGCDTGIGLIPFLAGQIEVCRLNAANHGQFVSCVSHLGNDLKKAGLITGAQKGQLTSCAGGSSLP
ncbi:MAG: peptidase, partial [Acidobacteria bacterium]|nr:peptidase [Acidobacteriota bacterium]